MESGYLEEDYRRVVEQPEAARTLPGTRVEILRESTSRRPPEHVLFDFDGTLSLIREGWTKVMVPLMVEVLRATGTGETPAELSHLADDFVAELTGKQTIYQMIRLAEEVRKRGGTPEEPAVYKQQYHDRLMERIGDRRQALRSGEVNRQEMLVPYSLELLDELRRRGAAMYLASGTDEPYVLEEVRLLGLEEYFGRRVYGALSDYKSFSKAMVIDRILRENRVNGDRLLGFGDGYVEIQNIKAVGGTAVGVASDEAGRSGRPDPWKRDRLIGVGADLIIPDYRDYRRLIEYLWK
ncbi:MAG: HAD family hydrolase [Pirellulales bacterium]|nr:HAD family hydrolase [Pirellulales bacterium]